MVCDETVRLVAEHVAAADALASATHNLAQEARKLGSHGGTFSEEYFNLLRNEVDRARAHAEWCREEVEQHIAEHGCLALRVATAGVLPGWRTRKPPDRNPGT